jgi:phosphoserine aminotransferase
MNRLKTGRLLVPVIGSFWIVLFSQQLKKQKVVLTEKKIVHNFNSGPSVLPNEVYQQASEAILDFNNSGLSILEIGHRTELFQAVMYEARQLVKEIMQLDDDHEVLFLHGGATTQFMQIPMNLLGEGQVASYTDTGTWGSKAIKEARLFGEVCVAGPTKENNYTSIPKELNIDPRSVYLHITTNETIAGTQWKNIPYDCGTTLVADMSSDIFSRSLDFNRFGLIYAGAQKNMGAAGVNLVVVNKNILGKISRQIPTILDYRNHVKEGSMLNTPPVFAVYVAMLTMRWLKRNGGIPAMETLNNEKAALFYSTLDSLPLFRGPVAREDRSTMNAVFVLSDPSLEKEFLMLCKENNMVGVKGHRSVGGFRVSMYNALTIDSVKAITGLMKDFATRKG